MAIAANFPTTRPSLLLDFSNQTVLDPRVTFARTTTALYYDNKSAALAEQNLLLQSNTLTTGWLNQGVSTPTQTATDPAGTVNGAWLVTPTAGTNWHYVAPPQPSIATSGTYVGTAYVQANGTNFGTISIGSTSGSTNYIAVPFNLTSGSVALGTTVTAGTVYTLVGSPSITQIGSTTWYRIAIAFTTTSAIAQVMVGSAQSLSVAPTNYGQVNYLATGTETLNVYGFQLEQRTSGLPTVYTATTATAVNTYTPTLQTAAINSPRFDYNPTTRESLGLLLEQASTNLALYSSDFTNAAWTRLNSTITATADISPDGTQNASLMVLGTTSAPKTIGQTTTFTAAVYTYSIYLKYYGQQFVQPYVNANGTIFCNFDLINGTAGTPSGSGSPTASILSVGNGWYRCSLTFTALAASAVSYVVASNSLTAAAAPSFAGNGFNGYLIWGAQVELAPSATSYIANTAGTATVRTIDSASMTGANFTSWYNYSGGTVYVEQASQNPLSAFASIVFAISDGGTNKLQLSYTSTGLNNFVQVNGVTTQNSIVALPVAPVANTFYKSAWYFSGAGNGISSVGQTPTTYATAVIVPAVNQINFSLGGSNNINGRIKKFAYYPLALTNTQIQSLSAN